MMDWGTTATIGIASCAVIFPSFWAFKASRNTASINGSTISTQVDQLHRLFVSHVDADAMQFKAGQLRDGELSAAILDNHNYTRSRWHKDDSRYTVIMSLISILANSKLSDDEKAESFAELQKRCMEKLKWDGHERRNEGDDHAEVPPHLG